MGVNYRYLGALNCLTHPMPKTGKPTRRLTAVAQHGSLLLLILGLLAGLFIADDYLEKRPRIQATRFLEQSNIPIEPASAVEAARSSRIVILEQLARAGVNLGAAAPDGQTPLLAAFNKDADETIHFLLEDDTALATIDQSEPNSFRNALAISLEKRNYGLAERLIGLGASPDSYLGENRPLLVEATETGDHEMLAFLLQNQANPELPGVDGNPALVCAIESQDDKRLQLLLDAGARVDIPGLTGDPLLIEAISHREINLVDKLISAGADPQKITPSGKTPLTVAMKTQHLPMVELLLASDIDLEKPDGDNVLPVDFAAAKQDAVLMKILLDHGASVRLETLETSFKKRDVATTSLLLEHGGADKAPSETIGRWLTESLRNGAMEMAHIMVQLGASAQGGLWDAIQTKRSDVIRFALENGAEVAEVSLEGQLPLDYALTMAQGDLAYQLLKRGASPNLKNADDEPWVAAAIRTGDLKCAEMLLEFGAELTDVVCSDGHSLLEWALARKANGVVKELLKAGAEPNRRIKSPASLEFRKQFKGRTFNWHLTADSQITPLMLATELRDLASATALMEAGAATGKHSKRYLWPINIAAWNADVPMQRLILKRDPHNYERKFVIDLSKQRGSLYEGGKVVYTTRVSTGKPGHRTPTGTYVVTDKHRHHTSSLYDSSMPYFQRFSCSAFGIHQGYVPNYPASHGCIRLPESAARHLFKKCVTGDVMIVQK